MNRPSGWRRFVRLGKNDPDADVEAELQFHLEMRARDLVALGMSLDEARAEAQRRFGDVERVRAECRRLEHRKGRRAVRLRAASDFVHDVRYAARTLARQPVFTIAAVLTLGLGIGINAAIFSAVNAYLIKPLAIREPDQVMAIATFVEGDDILSQVSYPNFEDVRAMRHVFDDAVIFGGYELAFRTGEEAVRTFTSEVSGNYFTALGVRAALGRVFTESEARERAPVIVLSHSFWDRHFRGDPGVVGHGVWLNGIPFTVIGVLPREFIGTHPLIAVDYFVPVDAMPLVAPGYERNFTDRSYSSYRVLARLRDGVTPAQARTALQTLGAELSQRFPDSNRGLIFTGEREVRTRPEYSISRMMPWVAGIFLGLVALALLVACANVANLLLARASARQGEIAVRSALGASGGRIARLLLAESFAISLAALAVALVFAHLAVAWLNNQPLQVDAPVHFGLAVDWRVFVYTAAIALGAGMVAGLTPALVGRRVAVSETLRQGGRTGSAGRGRSRFRASLVVAQVAVSFLLLVSASLFTRSVRAATRVDLGFRPEGILLASTDLSLHRYDKGQERNFHARVLELVRALPGVEHAALGTAIPFSGTFNTRDYFVDERHPALPDGQVVAGYEAMTPGMLEALGMRLIAGRAFTTTDDSSSLRVAMINRALAARLWPEAEPVGRRIRLEARGEPVLVVGVVENSQTLFLNETPRPKLYVPLAQAPEGRTYLVVRASGDPSSLTPAVRSAVAAVDPKVLVFGVRTMHDHLQYGLAYFFLRTAATLAGFIGLLGLVQTLVGLYGVLSYSVAMRGKEFGIRMALGARGADVTRGVLRQGSVLVLAGLAAGGVLALALTRTMRGFLVGVSPTDTLAFAGSAVVVIVAAFVSTYLPARRAARVAPGSALRAEG